MKVKYLIILSTMPFILGFLTSRYSPWWGVREQTSTPTTPTNGVKIYADSNNDFFSLHETATRYKVNIFDSDGGSDDDLSFTGAIDFGGATSLEIPNSNGDVTVNTGGEIAYDEAEDQLIIYDSQGGEVSGEEVAISVMPYISVRLDPGQWHDSDQDIFLMTIGDNFPGGFKIDKWKLSCNIDPDVEIDADLYYADDWITLANLTVIDVLDTTNGTSSEDTDSNINSGNVIANGKVLGVRINLDPEGTCTQMIFELWGHGID